MTTLPTLNVGAGAEAQQLPPGILTQQQPQLKWERDLPSSAEPTKMMQFGLASEAYADEVFKRFTDPWTDIPAPYQHGNANDKVLVGLLLKREIPDWATGRM